MAAERDPDPRKQTKACADFMKKGLGVLRCPEILIVDETEKGKIYDCPVCGAHFTSQG
jgi:hypothetical protein